MNDFLQGVLRGTDLKPRTDPPALISVISNKRLEPKAIRDIHY